MIMIMMGIRVVVVEVGGEDGGILMKRIMRILLPMESIRQCPTNHDGMMISQPLRR
jgi:hypothetical protein